MQIISISKRKFNELTKFKLPHENFGTEGTIYEFTYNNKEYALKELNNLDNQIFENKLYTIKKLNTNKNYLPSNFCYPHSLVEVENNIIGFTMQKIIGQNLTEVLKNDRVSYAEQIFYLKQIGKILNNLNNIRKNTPITDIYLNDLHESNFIVNTDTKKITVIDLDSCKIGTNKPSPAKYLTPFSLINGLTKYKINRDNNNFGHIIPNSNTDLYCYCIIILNYLYGDKINELKIYELSEYLNYLNYIGINKELIKIFQTLFFPEDNKNPMDFLDTLTEEQIINAKKYVYKKQNLMFK